jgi:uncharacterized protein (DUF58 family)
MPGHRYKYFPPEHAAQLRRLQLTVRSVVEGVFAGLHKSPHKGFSIEFAEHREYVPGDELKHLDWTLLARSDRYYIKQYEQETNLRATICLDASASMNFSAAQLTPQKKARKRTPNPGTAVPGLTPANETNRPHSTTKFDYAATLAASLAFLLSNQQDLVGLTAFDTDIAVEMPQGNGPSHLDQLFKLLEAITPEKETNVANALHHLANKIPRRGLVILLSDLLDDPDQILLALQHLRHARHQLIVIQVLDPSELDLAAGIPGMGGGLNRPVTFLDQENASRLPIDPKLIREDYRREMQAFLDSLRLRCAQHRIDYLLALTSTPWHTQIRELLQRLAT